MSSPPYEELQALLTRCSRLSRQLYSFSSKVGLSTRELTNLASRINELGKACKSLAPHLKGSEVPSLNASTDILEIVSQCDLVFKEIKAITPIEEDREKDLSNLTYSLDREWSWDSLSRAKLEIFEAYIRALEKTLGLMEQTFSAARSIAESRGWQPGSNDSIIDERHQLENLAVEQQLALARAIRLHQDMVVSQAKSRVEDLSIEELSISPRSLAVSPPGAPVDSTTLTIYQNPSLNLDMMSRFQEESVRKAGRQCNEKETLARINHTHAGYVDTLIRSWTNTAPRLAAASDSDCREFEEEVWRRKSLQPTCETVDDTEAGPKHDGGPVEHPTTTPIHECAEVLAPRAGFQRAQTDPRIRTTPIAIPMTAGISRSSTSSRAPLGNTFSGPSSAASTFTTPCTPNTQRGSVSWGMPPASPASGRPKAPSVVSYSSQTSELYDDKLNIPWRLQLHHFTWDFVDNMLVKESGANVTLAQARGDKRSKTQIPVKWVCREALEDLGFKYRQIDHEIESSRQTKFEKCIEIEGAVDFEDILKLVELTSQMYGVAIMQKGGRRSSQTQTSRPPHPSRAHTTALVSMGPDAGSGRRASRPEYGLLNDKDQQEFRRMVRERHEDYQENKQRLAKRERRDSARATDVSHLASRYRPRDEREYRREREREEREYAADRERERARGIRRLGDREAAEYYDQHDSRPRRRMSSSASVPAAVCWRGDVDNLTYASGGSNGGAQNVSVPHGRSIRDPGKQDRDRDRDMSDRSGSDRSVHSGSDHTRRRRSVSRRRSDRGRDRSGDYDRARDRDRDRDSKRSNSSASNAKRRGSSGNSLMSVAAAVGLGSLLPDIMM